MARLYNDRKVATELEDFDCEGETGEGGKGERFGTLEGITTVFKEICVWPLCVTVVVAVGIVGSITAMTGRPREQAQERRLGQTEDRLSPAIVFTCSRSLLMSSC